MDRNPVYITKFSQLGANVFGFKSIIIPCIEIIIYACKFYDSVALRKWAVTLCWIWTPNSPTDWLCTTMNNCNLKGWVGVGVDASVWPARSEDL